MKKVVIILLSSFALVKASAQTGIGTTAPVNKLQIEATTADPATSGSSANGNLRLSGTGATHVLDFGLSSTSTFSWLQARSKSNYSTNYNLALNPNGGKVGIGISTPLVALHIQNGNVFSGSDDPSTNTVPSFYVYNNNNSSTSAHAISLVRTAGTGSGKPYYALDVNGAFGYSMGINNPTDQMIINASWNFNTTAANNAIIINRAGQTRVAIPEKGGAYNTDWPSGWGGGLSTYDVCAASIQASNFINRSDRRLKNNIIDLDSASIMKYLQLRPVNFYWNQDKPRDTKLQYGFIAQEVETIFPELVNTATDSMQTKSMNYQALHALSLKVIQAQQVEIETLKKKQADLEQRLLKLEAKLNP